MTIQTALEQARALLEDTGIAVPHLTAEVLLSHCLGCERSFVLGHPETELNDLTLVRFGESVRQRMAGKPTQYITGRQEFYGREFTVTPDVMIPRPETEHVIENALAILPGARRIVDAGCGSGCIGVTLSLETGGEVWGTDISLAALSVAAENAERLGARVHFVACDLLAALAPRSFDLVVSNPPYVPLGDAAGLQREVRDHEPRVALFAGDTGLDLYARLVEEASRVLRAGGALIMELGFKLSEPVRAMLGPPWQAVRIAPDLAGIPRVVSAKLL
jgi:release factor glutamine methyltransferase